MLNSSNALIQRLKDILEDLQFQTQLNKLNVSLNDQVFEYQHTLDLLNVELCHSLPKNIMLLEEICSILYLGANTINIKQFQYSLRELEKELDFV